MAASNKRGVWRVLAVLVPALLLAAGLVLAAPDNTPTAEAHQVECKPTGDFGCYAYNYTHTHPKPTPAPTPAPTPKPECPGGSHKHTGWGGCHSIFLVHPKPTPAPTPKPECPGGSHKHAGWGGCHSIFLVHPKPTPTPKPCSFLSHRHGSTGACHYTLKQCNGTWIDHDATCPPKAKPTTTPEPTADPDPPPTPRVDPPPTPAPTPKPGGNGCKPGEHPHGNTCHADHAKCAPGKYEDERVTVYGHVRDSHGDVSVLGCDTRPNTGNCTPGNVPDGQHLHTRRGETFCHADHPCPASHSYTPPLPIIYFVYTSATAELMTHEQLNEYYKSGKTASANLGKWEKDGSHDCYKAVEDTGTTINLYQIVVDGVTHLVREGGKIAIKGVDYVIEGGKIIIDQYDKLPGPAKHALERAALQFIGGLPLAQFWTLFNLAGEALKLACANSHTRAVSSNGIAAVGGALLANSGTTVLAALGVTAPPLAVGIGIAFGVGLTTHYVLEYGCPLVDKYLNSDSDSDDSSQSVPGSVSGLSASAGVGEIAVSWTASATTPGAGFGYRVQWMSGAQSWAESEAADQFEDLEHGSDLATSYTISGLSGGSAYDVRVAAFNAEGFSDWVSGTATPTKPKPSLAFDSVSCQSSGSGWVISVSWSKTPETLKPDIWANETKNRGHRGLQKAVAGTSTTFDVPNAGWYQIGMQAKIAGNKKVGDDKPVRCR